MALTLSATCTFRLYVDTQVKEEMISKAIALTDRYSPSSKWWVTFALVTLTLLGI